MQVWQTTETLYLHAELGVPLDSSKWSHPGTLWQGACLLWV